MGPGGPSPEEMISTLPTDLQGSYMGTMKLEHTAHMQAEVRVMKSIVKTLRETKKYLRGANEDEKAAIAKVLFYLEHQDPENGHGGHRPEMGSEGPSAESVEKMVNQMIRDTRKEIKELQQEIRKARAK